MSLIEDIRKDREAGTPGPWAWDGDRLRHVFSVQEYAGVGWIEWTDQIDGPNFQYPDNDAATVDAESNARRIARVPQMEAALLAADALAASVGRSDSWFEIDAALDAYLAATGAA